jgi:hypothetical protein
MNGSDFARQSHGGFPDVCVSRKAWSQTSLAEYVLDAPLSKVLTRGFSVIPITERANPEISRFRISPHCGLSGKTSVRFQPLS